MGSRIRPLTLLAAACGVGAGEHGTRDGPIDLRAHGLDALLTHHGIAPTWQEFWEGEGSPTDVIATLCASLAQATEQGVAAGNKCLVLGGDHSIAAGTWSGAANALHAKGQDLGLIWLDAHLDAHVPATSPSGRWHGMPVAHLLGHGLPELTRLSRHSRPALKPRHVCHLGIRSYEDGEARLLEQEGVRIIHADEVRARGWQSCWNEALAIAGAASGGFGVSFDVDVLDPTHAPGVGSPVPDGLAPAEVHGMLAGLLHHPRLVGLEAVEYNPHHDLSHRTRTLVLTLLTAALTTVHQP